MADDKFIRVMCRYYQSGKSCTHLCLRVSYIPGYIILWLRRDRVHRIATRELKIVICEPYKESEINHG